MGFLSLLRRWREAAFLTIALVLEITVFLSVTFVVDRQGVVRHVFNSQLQATQHVREAIGALRELHGA